MRGPPGGAASAEQGDLARDPFRVSRTRPACHGLNICHVFNVKESQHFLLWFLTESLVVEVAFTCPHQTGGQRLAGVKGLTSHHTQSQDWSLAVRVSLSLNQAAPLLPLLIWFQLVRPP